jgi:hypothetical protein
MNVGAARFELATSWSQTRRDDRTTLRPENVLFKRTTLTSVAVRAGFEPAVQLPVRQFSKLFLSASQAPHLALPF